MLVSIVSNPDTPQKSAQCFADVRIFRSENNQPSI